MLRKLKVMIFIAGALVCFLALPQVIQAQQPCAGNCSSQKQFQLVNEHQRLALQRLHTHFTRKVCNPCELTNWGYNNTCWQVWPFPPNYSHCPFPIAGHTGPPLASVQGAHDPVEVVPIPAGQPGPGGQQQLPPPRPGDGNPAPKK